MAHPGISSEWPKNMNWNFWISSKDWHAKMHISKTAFPKNQLSPRAKSL